MIDTRKESRIYTVSLAEYLTSKGFNYIRKVQDINNPRYFNWIFEDTPELHSAIREFKRERDMDA